MAKFIEAGPPGLLLTIALALCSCADDGAEPRGGTPMGTPGSGDGDVRLKVESSSPKTRAGGDTPNSDEKRPSAEHAALAPPKGRWTEVKGAGRQQRKPEAELAGLGYSGAYEVSGDLSGAIVHDADRIEPGFTLFCSGHDTSVLLIDAEGNVVHHWHLDFNEIFPDPLPFEAQAFHSEFVRRAWPYPNGELLAVFEYTGIVRVNADGKPIWALPNQSHHDFKVLGDGSIVTLDIVRREPAWVFKHYSTRRFRKGVIDSHVVFLSGAGEVLRKVSIFDAFHRSRFASFLNTVSPQPEDIFHANSVDVLDAAVAENHPSFEEGDILVSLRNPSAVVVIDGQTEQVKWITRGISTAQHQASFLSTGSVLLLDNAGGNQTFPLKPDRSRIIEIVPETQEIGWRYPPLGQDVDFYTSMLGYVERLPGGNTLITESTAGHLIEVSPDGQVVWEYYSPYRAGENDELTATLMGARRISGAALPFLDE